jgi:hypothetical protein
VKLPHDALVTRTDVTKINDKWGALVEFKVPGKGGHDRADSDDVFRIFRGADAEERARAWIADKQNNRLPAPEPVVQRKSMQRTSAA